MEIQRQAKSPEGVALSVGEPRRGLVSFPLQPRVDTRGYGWAAPLGQTTCSGSPLEAGECPEKELSPDWFIVYSSFFGGSGGGMGTQAK